MKTKNNIFIIILSLLLGAVFLFSAYSKTVPNLQTFEFTLTGQLKIPKLIAAIAARFFIGLEAAIGLLLLTMIYGKRKWVLKGCLALLFLFSIHLIILWAVMGNDVDCGCMGTLIAMSPLVSLLKNVGLIICTLLLIKYYKQGDEKTRTETEMVSFTENKDNKQSHEKTHDLLPIGAIIAFIIMPFFVFPIQKHQTLVLNSTSFDQNNVPKINLNQGKHIICFMSLTCSHCRDAAKKIHEISNRNPNIPFYFIFPKADNDTIQDLALQDFMKDTKDNQIPHSFIAYKDFVKLLNEAGETGVPSIFWVSDSTIMRKMSGEELNQKEMELWIK